MTLKSRSLQILAVLFALLALTTALTFLLSDSLPVKSLAKPVPVLLMAVWILLRSERMSRYRVTVAVGLVLGAAADVIIMRWFVPGLLLFLLSHIVYIAAFLADVRSWQLRRALPGFAFGAIVYCLALIIGDLGDMAGPVGLYTVVISTMLWRSMAREAEDSIPGRSRRAGVIGAVLFVASDTILLVNIFITPLPASGWLIMIPYWAGQAGIALSALWRTDDKTE